MSNKYERLTDRCRANARFLMLGAALAVGAPACAHAPRGEPGAREEGEVTVTSAEIELGCPQEIRVEENPSATLAAIYTLHVRSTQPQDGKLTINFTVDDSVGNRLLDTVSEAVILAGKAAEPQGGALALWQTYAVGGKVTITANLTVSGAAQYSLLKTCRFPVH